MNYEEKSSINHRMKISCHGNVFCINGSYCCVNIGSGNGSSPAQCQAITWIQIDLLSIGPSQTNFNSFWPGDAIWRHRTWSILAQVMACCLMAPDGSEPLPEPMLTDHQWGPVTITRGQFHKRYLSHQLRKLDWNYISKISFKSPRGLWVNSLRPNDAYMCR